MTFDQLVNVIKRRRTRATKMDPETVSAEDLAAQLSAAIASDFGE